MRIAFLADIHANFPALEAVIADAKARGVTHVVCLGDIVGYGPQPVETLECVRRVASATVMGNHDAAACGLLDPNLFNNFARETAARAALALNQDEKNWLKDLPYVLEGNGFACAHGGFVSPGTFRYLETKQDALHCFAAMPDFPLLVVGHTHIPCLFVQDSPNQPVRKLPPTDITLRPGMRIIINPGSVGFPRTDTLSADYAVYDTQTHRITFISFGYDIAPYRLALVRNGYNPMNYWFLSPSARKRQTEQAYLNPMRVAEAPLGSGKTFRPKKPRGILTLPKTFWVLVFLFFCLAIVSIGVLWPIISATSQPVIAQKTQNSIGLLPTFENWSIPESKTVKVAKTTESVTLSPVVSSARCLLTSPLVKIPSGVKKLRLTFAIDGAKPKARLAEMCRSRIVFYSPQGQQIGVDTHPYKKPLSTAYQIEVKAGASHLQHQVEFLHIDSQLRLALPILTVIE